MSDSRSVDEMHVQTLLFVVCNIWHIGTT